MASFYDGEKGAIIHKAGEGAPKSNFIWDVGSFTPEGPPGGTYEDGIIHLDTVYPRLKHWYTGNFPSHLSGINWLIKTMDRPKLDVESVEQIRNNVVRNYPVKYSVGDVSITFWDDVDHRTMDTIEQYFHGSVWDHGGNKSGPGDFLMRDSILIPKFEIMEHTVAEKIDRKYVFYNSVLVSIDMDSDDDEGDESVYTVQVVLKPEGYETVVDKKNPKDPEFA